MPASSVKQKTRAGPGGGHQLLPQKKGVGSSNTLLPRKKSSNGLRRNKSPAKKKDMIRPADILRKAGETLRDRIRSTDFKKVLVPNIPYFIIFYIVEKEAWLYRYCTGNTMIQKLMNLLLYFSLAFQNPIPSFYWRDLLIGGAGVGVIKFVIWYRRKNAKKYRQGAEYGSARWGTAKDIAPFVDPVFDNNIILTRTEFLTMNSRPKDWRYARNKNVIVIGGSGSGKTRYYVKPNILQMAENVSVVVTDPKISIRAILIPEHYLLKGSSGLFYTQL